MKRGKLNQTETKMTGMRYQLKSFLDVCTLAKFPRDANSKKEVGYNGVVKSRMLPTQERLSSQYINPTGNMTSN